ncbi:hypothetical protein [Burkholderia sp. Ac-20365]|uniref:hypothetical protein n=1 Tax=Burkholderia sp. Ac-20365 TaxID=2703897 RepID=UPI00197C9422|nr:hypothetical protein [Burkholderia sp. Ac-20365]MBN3762449.1 hypothetical protein [Burkholderia sp. Ac-20365]
MNSVNEIDYQRQLIASCLDDFSPNAALPHVYGGQYGQSPEMWKRAVVEFLCVNVRCGLLEATHRKDISTDDDSVLSLENLLTNGDTENQLDAEIVWNAMYFNSTCKLDEILERFNLRTWDALNFGLNHALIAELKKLYANS